MNIPYAKIIDNGNAIEVVPTEFIENGMRICGDFTAEFLMERGYYPIDYTYPGDEIHTYIPFYTLINNVIEQTWTLVEGT